MECAARVPSTSGRQGEGKPYWATPVGQPLRFTIGAGQVSAPGAPRKLVLACLSMRSPVKRGTLCWVAERGCIHQSACAAGCAQVCASLHYIRHGSSPCVAVFMAVIEPPSAVALMVRVGMMDVARLATVLLQVPRGLEEAVCALAKRERAIVSCPAALAGSGGDQRGGRQGGQRRRCRPRARACACAAATAQHGPCGV